MTILTKARRVKLIKSGGEYPGFMSFTGDYNGVENRGLMMFTASIIIKQHPGNYDEIDIRKNPTGWCFGSTIDIQLENDTGDYVHPICIPKLFIKSGFYSPVDLELRLEVGDALSLYENYNTDYWRNPEEESLEDTDNTEEPGKYWWEVWQKKGEAVALSSIFSTIAGKLRLTTDGLLSGTIQQPWTLSGGLVAAMGELAYKSNNPSFIWSDRLGVVRISEIDINKATSQTYSMTDLVDYKPVDSSPQVVSQLIFSAKILEKVEVDPGLIPEENDQGFGRFCSKNLTYGPIGAVNGTSDISETLYAEEKTCEEIYPNLKRTTIERKELKCLVFPDIKQGRSVMIQSYEKIHLQLFSDTENNRLYREEITEKEPWGKVFREFYESHSNWVIDDLEDIIIPPPPFPDEAMFFEEMTTTYFEVKKYVYNLSGKVTRIETEIKEPESKILTDVIYESRHMSARLITVSMITETWMRWGNNERHEKNERTTMQRKYKDLIEKKEEYLAETNILSKKGGTTIYGAPTIVVTTYLRQGDTIIYGSEDMAQSMVTRAERLALVSERPTGESSREGNTTAPATEYLPDVDPEANPEGDDFKEKPIFTRRSWDSPCPNVVVPSREVIDIGLVPTRTYLEAIADLMFTLRQGQAYSYEGTFAMSEEWLTGTFDPLPRIDITEPDGTTFVYLGHGITIDIGDVENILNIDLLWLGTQ